jgi:hypothetical protein
MKTPASNFVDVTATVTTNRSSLPRKMAVAAVLFASTSLFNLSEARATTLMEGSDLSPYAVVSVGPSASIMVNSGPITGKVLLGDGSTANSSGGNHGSVTGGVFTDKASTNLSHLATPPVTSMVSSAITTGAFNEASTLSGEAEALTATQTFGAKLTGTTTITGDGGLNVIDLKGGLQNDKLTLDGDSKDVFVFIVSGTFQDNEAMTLSKNVSASHILWDFTGTSGNVFQTSGGDQLYGTFIDTHGGDFQFSELDLIAGQLINTAGHIQFVSGSQIQGSTPFIGTPEPSAWAMMLVGTGAVGTLLRRRRRLVAAAL